MDFDTIAKVLGEQLDVKDVSKITPETKIIQDLGADSLDVVELLITLEDDFGVSISDEEVASIVTVGDLMNLIEARQ